jgi:hypothetical protein
VGREVGEEAVNRLRRMRQAQVAWENKCLARSNNSAGGGRATKAVPVTVTGCEEKRR